MPTATRATPARVSLAPLPDLADADLVRRARDGDDRAFEEIVRRYRAPLIRYSSRHVGRDHAEDVTQHAFARAAMHLRDDPRPIHLRAWLYRVAHNAAINMRARKDWGHEELSPDIDGVPQPPDVAAQRTEVRQVVANMDDLPERQRAALRMSVFEGLDYEEIARELETSPNSVRALLSRARAQLRKAAAALSPLPLLAWLSRKTYGLAGAAGPAEGSVAAVGGVAQVKLIAIAATTVVAGAATVDRANSTEPAIDPPSGIAMASAADPAARAALAINVDSLISEATAAPNAIAKEPPAAPAEEAPPVEEPPVEPVADVPVTEEPAPVEPPPLPPADPPADDSVPKDPPADDEPPPDEYVPPPTDDYTGGDGDSYGTTESDAYGTT